MRAAVAKPLRERKPDAAANIGTRTVGWASPEYRWAPLWDAEDRTEKSTVTPGPLAPARELYGDAARRRPEGLCVAG